MRHAVVYFPGGARVFVEVPTHHYEILRGLMFRWVVPEGTGMLFDFGHTAVHPMWMKNTFVPLDLLFLDEGGAVVGIVEQTVPLDLTFRSVATPSRYVLEVPGGWSGRQGVALGQRVSIAMLSP